MMDDWDRTSTNDDGQTFYGYDDKDSNTTTWYTDDGDCDCQTSIPCDDD